MLLCLSNWPCGLEETVHVCSSCQAIVAYRHLGLFLGGEHFEASNERGANLVTQWPDPVLETGIHKLEPIYSQGHEED